MKKPTLKRITKWMGLALLVVLGILLLVAAVPISTAGLATDPRPATDYDEYGPTLDELKKMSREELRAIVTGSKMGQMAQI